MRRLLVEISSHGLGHLGQTSPVLDALFGALPGLEITVRSKLPEATLKRRIGAPFRHVREEADFGYVMRNAVDIDLEATRRRYRDFHRDWQAAIAADARWIHEQRFDLVLSNVAYRPLAAAARQGIPGVALCSLNWADMFQASFGTEESMRTIHAQMLEAYRSARIFLRVTPGLPMASLPNARAIGPICRLQSPDRTALARQLGISAAEMWILVALGGMQFPIDFRRWPRIPGTRYLVPKAAAIERADVTAFDSLRIDFSSLLASSDLVVTKAGYGMFVESACHGRPVLYLAREDWPEDVFLTAWLHEHARAKRISRQTLLDGDLGDAIEALRKEPMRPVPVPSGTREALDMLTTMLSA